MQCRKLFIIHFLTSSPSSIFLHFPKCSLMHIKKGSSWTLSSSEGKGSRIGSEMELNELEVWSLVITSVKTSR